MNNHGQATYNLNAIQQMIRGGDYYITAKASNDAYGLGFNDSGIASVILSLSPANFYKTMPSGRLNGAWQDVYHCNHSCFVLYIKLQIVSSAVIISFKEK
ncbi:MAG TPA: type II toxin-antitoxin system MqsR family toxin [Campylobacterales bacterium]|nr:type II toxin-antitoxin system MqsR family toxin [Campylobacterales bacterium]